MKLFGAVVLGLWWGCPHNGVRYHHNTKRNSAFRGKQRDKNRLKKRQMPIMPTTVWSCLSGARAAVENGNPVLNCTESKDMTAKKNRTVSHVTVSCNSTTRKKNNPKDHAYAPLRSPPTGSILAPHRPHKKTPRLPSMELLNRLLRHRRRRDVQPGRNAQVQL